MKLPAGPASALPSAETSPGWEGVAEKEDRVPGRWGVNKHALDVTSEDFNE